MNGLISGAAAPTQSVLIRTKSRVPFTALQLGIAGSGLVSLPSETAPLTDGEEVPQTLAEQNNNSHPAGTPCAQHAGAWRGAGSRPVLREVEEEEEGEIQPHPAPKCIS